MDESLARELHRAARRKRPVSVVLFDLDGFKSFNDAHGHVAGDRYLAAFAAYLKRQFRSEDVLCRYGGEEFLAILPECTASDARARAEVVRRGLAGLRIAFDGAELGPLTVSGGIAEHPRDGDTPTQLLQSADAALYRAKESGRDRILLATPAADATRRPDRRGMEEAAQD